MYPVPYDPPPVPPIRPTPTTCTHVLHFLIGLITCGLWWVVWLVVALDCSQKNKDAEAWYAQASQQYSYELWAWRKRNGL